MSDLEGDELVQESKTFEDWHPASPSIRVGAFLLDSVIVLILLLVVLSPSHIETTWPAKAYLWAILMWVWEGMWLSFWARTPGRFLLGLAIYSPNDDAPPTPLQVCVRILAFWTTAPLLGLGLTPILYRTDRSGWHDQLSETVTTTNAAKGSRPSPRLRRLGHTLIIIQSLVLFASGGAALLTQGLRLSKGDTSALVALSCDNTKLAYERPDAFLTAMLVGPSWNICWQQMRTNLLVFSDSQYFKIVDAVHKAHLISLYQPELRPVLFRKEIAPLYREVCRSEDTGKDCDTLRLLGSLLNAGVDKPPSANNWLNAYESFLRDFFSARSQEQRIQALQTMSEKKTLPLILSTAVAERQWAEVLPWSAEVLQDLPPFSPSADWSQQQICWREALLLKADDLCPKNPYRHGVQFIKQLQSGSVSADEAENFLGDNRQLPEEIEQAIQVWIAVQKKNPREAIEGWRQTRLIDPLYMYIEQWYRALKP